MLQKPSDDLKLGELLVRNGLLTEEQLHHALLVQQIRAVYKPLGEVCKDLGYITRTDLRGMLDRYRKRIPLGSLLLKMGIINELKLETGLAAGQLSGERLGQILVKKAFITQAALRVALGIQLTIPTVAPDPALIDKNLLESVNANFLYKNNAIPVRYNKDEKVLTVVMEDPLDVQTVADLEKIFKTRIEPAMLTYGEIKHVLDAALDPWAARSFGGSTPSGSGSLKFVRKTDDAVIIE